MFIVMVRTPLKIFSGIIDWPPATMITAMVSPIARPIPRMIDAKIPDFAAGTTIDIVALSCEAPSATAPS
jgi:hypothetical protein